MKTVLRVFSATCLFFVAFFSFLTTIAHLIGPPRREWTTDSLLELINTISVLLFLYFISKIGLFLCNTYNFKIERTR